MHDTMADDAQSFRRCPVTGARRDPEILEHVARGRAVPAKRNLLGDPLGPGPERS